MCSTHNFNSHSGTPCVAQTCYISQCCIQYCHSPESIFIFNCSWWSTSGCQHTQQEWIAGFQLFQSLPQVIVFETLPDSWVNHMNHGARECFQSYPLVLKHISPENPLSNSMFLLCICKCTYIIFINLIIYFYMHTHMYIYIYA